MIVFSSINKIIPKAITEVAKSIATILRYIFFNSSRALRLANFPLKYKIDKSNPSKQMVPTAKRNDRAKSYCPTNFGLYDFVKNTVKPNNKRTPKILKNKVPKLCLKNGFCESLSKIELVFNCFKVDSLLILQAVCDRIF